jgi:peptidoglycan hydrolase CwlO-like protein
MQPELVLFIAISVGIVISLVTLVVAVGVLREGRRVSETLQEKLSKAEHELQRAQWAEIDAQKEVDKLKERLVEQRPEKLMGKLEQATVELEQLQLGLSESERLVGQQKQEYSEAQQRVERLSQLRDKLRAEMDDIDATSTEAF